MCKDLFEKLMEIIFPRKCAFCNILIKEDYTCKKCKKKLEYICINCNIQKSNSEYFDFLICPFFYDGIIKSKILEFKFKNKKYLYKPLSQELINILMYYKNLIDIIIPVPISLARYFERGYNQSKLVADYVSKKINKPLALWVLIKTKNNYMQSKLNMQTRSNNVKNVYKVLNTEKIKGKNILLIDDIYTTGATVTECSKILKQNGAQKIIVATIAKTKIKWI